MNTGTRIWESNTRTVYHEHRDFHFLTRLYLAKSYKLQVYQLQIQKHNEKNNIFTGNAVCTFFHVRKQSHGRQEIRIPLECNTSMEFSIHHLHLFAIDRDNRIARHETFTSSDIHENTLHATLPLGRYRLASWPTLPRETWLFRKPEKHLKTCSFAYHMKKTLTKSQ